MLTCSASVSTARRTSDNRLARRAVKTDVSPTSTWRVPPSLIIEDRVGLGGLGGSPGGSGRVCCAGRSGRAGRPFRDVLRAGSVGPWRPGGLVAVLATGAWGGWGWVPGARVAPLGVCRCRGPVPSRSGFQVGWWAQVGRARRGGVPGRAQGSRWSSRFGSANTLPRSAGTGPGQGDLLRGRWPPAQVVTFSTSTPRVITSAEPNARGGLRPPTPAPGRHRGSAHSPGHPARCRACTSTAATPDTRIQPPRPAAPTGQRPAAGTRSHPCSRPAPVAGPRLVGECHQRVEGVGLHRLGAAGSAGGGEHLVGERVQHHGERAPACGCPRVQVPEPSPSTYRRNRGPDAAGGWWPPGPGRRGPHPGAFLPQLRNRDPPGNSTSRCSSAEFAATAAEMTAACASTSRAPPPPGLPRQPGRGVQRILRRPGRRAGPAGQVLDCGLGPSLSAGGLATRRATTSSRPHTRSDLPARPQLTAVDPLTASGSNRRPNRPTDPESPPPPRTCVRPTRPHRQHTRYPQVPKTPITQPSQKGSMLPPGRS